VGRPGPGRRRVTELLSLAERVAREAGAQLREAFSAAAVDIQTKSTPTDLVSAADLAAERLIREHLLRERPDDGMLGEEGSDSPGTSGLRWIVDPLDGTTNFLFGIPQWCVSIAVEDESGTLAGLVFDPMRDEVWAAVRGEPPTLDGTPLRRPERSGGLATALVATGFGYEADVRAVQAAGVSRLLPRVRDIRRLGSAALDLAWTAAGRYDAFYERGIKLWDIAAGELICQSAGLHTRRLAPAPPAEAGILIAPAVLADELASLVD
jgi:myo-inositol-1(or 4)-monophosphatase